MPVLQPANRKWQTANGRMGPKGEGNGTAKGKGPNQKGPKGHENPGQPYALAPATTELGQSSEDRVSGSRDSRTRVFAPDLIRLLWIPSKRTERPFDAVVQIFRNLRDHLPQFQRLQP